MPRRSDTPSRSEISERIDGDAERMREKEGDIETTVSDIETVRHTLENLDLGGTSEGSEAVEGAIQGAEDVTVEVFDGQDTELEEIQGEDEEYECEVDERTDSVESDLGKVSDASIQIDTDEGVNELIKAKEAALQDIDFFKEQGERAREAREESERIQQEYQARAHAQGR